VEGGGGCGILEESAIGCVGEGEGEDTRETEGSGSGGVMRCLLEMDSLKTLCGRMVYGGVMVANVNSDLDSSVMYTKFERKREGESE